MSDKLTIVIAGEPVVEYDREKPLSSSQLTSLERIEARMDAGISLDGARVREPNPLQRAQFIALHLVDAIRAGDDARVAASCGYLATRVPELKQVLVTENAVAPPTIDLVFDKPYAPQATVQFMHPGKG